MNYTTELLTLLKQIVQMPKNQRWIGIDLLSFLYSLGKWLGEDHRYMQHRQWIPSSGRVPWGYEGRCNAFNGRRYTKDIIRWYQLYQFQEIWNGEAPSFYPTETLSFYGSIGAALSIELWVSTSYGIVFDIRAASDRGAADAMVNIFC